MFFCYKKLGCTLLHVWRLLRYILYFSIDQLDYEEDAFDVMDQIKDFRGIDLAKRPGILF